jgi:hypothetical protein
MLTAAAKRKYRAAFKRRPVIIAGTLQKCSVCGLLIALLVVIGTQAPDIGNSAAQSNDPENRFASSLLSPPR